MHLLEVKVMKISSENFFLCWMLFWTGMYCTVLYRVQLFSHLQITFYIFLLFLSQLCNLGERGECAVQRAEF